jgi:hypothetical protein
MKLSLLLRRFSAFETLASLLSIVMVASISLTGCGSGNPQSRLSGNTAVTMLASGTANDRLSEFGVTFNSVTLISNSGKKVSLLSSPQSAEFAHLNGTSEPILSVTIPQDVYTAATAEIGYTYFTCATLTPSGGVDTSTFAYGYVPSSFVTMRLPSGSRSRATAWGYRSICRHSSRRALRLATFRQVPLLPIP